MASSRSITELRKLEAAELHREVAEKRAVAMKLRLGLQAGSDKDSSKYRAIKKDIARHLTVINEKRRANDLKTDVKAPTVAVPKTAARTRARKSSSKA